MIALLLQIAPPQDGDNAWVWIAGVMAVALGTLAVRYDSFRNAQLKREQDTSDALRTERKTDSAVIADLTTAIRELQALIKNGRP